MGIAESDAAVELGQKNLAASLNRAVTKNKLNQSQSDEITARVMWGTDFGLLSDCDLVVEAAPEKMELKRSIFEKLDAATKPTAILATNTSSLSVTQIAEVTVRPQLVIGMHFFNPAPVQKFVEVIRAKNTSPDVVEAVTQLAQALGKHAAVIDDQPGFIVNRLLLAYINHAAKLVDSGYATASQIDFGMREYAKFPMGPLELADLIGLDTCVEVMKTVHAYTHRHLDDPAEGMVALVAAGNLGRKSGQGYYDYSTAHEVPVSSNSVLERESYGKLITAYFGDAIAMYESGYASTQDIDAGMTLGCGIPHGPFEEIERVGIEQVKNNLRILADRTGNSEFLPR